QPTLSQQLRNQKLEALQAGQPDYISTANVGCQIHLQSGSETPVCHWLDLCADALAPLLEDCSD
ncbi:glycolate oxidase subunit GlcF, partial [Acidithiobacillus ferridurans]|nr:glycolate oxidase subunit GlcF [Acidithiobacillus ferridurans]